MMVPANRADLADSLKTSEPEFPVTTGLEPGRWSRCNSSPFVFSFDLSDELKLTDSII